MIGYATMTAGRGQASFTVTRRSAVDGFSRGYSRVMTRSDFGMRPKYFVTISFVCAMSKSPTIAIVALWGT